MFFPDNPAPPKAANQQPTLDLKESEAEPAEVKADPAPAKAELVEAQPLEEQTDTAAVKAEVVEAEPVEAKMEPPDAAAETTITEPEPERTTAALEPTQAPETPVSMDELSFAFEDPATIDAPKPAPPVIEPKPVERPPIEAKPMEEFPKSFAQDWLDEGPMIDETEPFAEIAGCGNAGVRAGRRADRRSPLQTGGRNRAGRRRGCGRCYARRAGLDCA